MSVEVESVDSQSDGRSDICVFRGDLHGDIEVGAAPLTVIVSGVYQTDDGVLFVKSSRDGRAWELPSGHLEPGERPFDTLTRELQEEAGVDVETADPLATFVWNTETGVLVQFVYEVTSASGPEGATTDEIADTAFFVDLPDAVSYGSVGREVYERVRICLSAHDGA